MNSALHATLALANLRQETSRVGEATMPSSRSLAMVAMFCAPIVGVGAAAGAFLGHPILGGLAGGVAGIALLDVITTENS